MVQPHKGPRKQVSSTRVHTDVFSMLEDESDRLGVPKSDLIAHAVCVVFGMEGHSPLRDRDVEKPRSSSKGERWQVATTRVHPDVYDWLDESASGLGISKSDFLADMLAQMAGLPDASPLYGRGDRARQLDMSA